MYLSIKTARKLLRKEAGYTIAVSAEEVDALPKKQFGKRQKVKQADVARIIAEASKPTPIVIDETAPKIRPFRKSLVNQIRRSGRLSTRQSIPLFRHQFLG